MKYVLDVVITTDVRVTRKAIREAVEAALQGAKAQSATMLRIRVRSVDTD